MPDVICFGGILPDRVIQLPRLPLPGESLHALQEQTFMGGEPCNVAGHLARWGVPVGLAGNNLGNDQRAAFVERELRQRPRTSLFIERDPAMSTPTCYILTTPDGERTIIASWGEHRSFSLPPAAVVAQARLVSISIYGPGLEAMVALAQAQRTPLALSDVPVNDQERLRGAAIITTSQATLTQRYGVTDVRGWIEHVWQATRALIVVSDGPHAVLVRTADGRDLAATPPQITPLDTTGAGDVLKATIIYGYLHAWPIEQTLDRAIERAAAVCLQLGPCPVVE